ncbi:MAG TPA: hypothetical protein VGH14_00015, partial [Solirubrobacterales bacterium]
MRRLLSAVLLLLALAGGAYLLSQGTTTPASAAATPRVAKPPKGFFGVVPQTALTEKDVKYMKAGGIEAIRWPLIWPAIQPTK